MFRANFGKLCLDYGNVVKFAKKYKFFINDNPFLKDNVTKYLDRPNKVNCDNDYEKFVLSTHKLSPLKYFHQDQIDSQWLVDACNRHANFCERLYDSNLKFNLHKWLNEYNKFLDMCKLYPNKVIVPTLPQDFMWHAHMQDNESYVLDTKRKLGKILGHDDNIEEKLLEQYKKETQELRKSNESNNTLYTQSACAMFIPVHDDYILDSRSVASSSSCSSSSCSSSCSSSSCSSSSCSSSSD